MKRRTRINTPLSLLIVKINQLSKLLTMTKIQNKQLESKHCEIEEFSRCSELIPYDLTPEESSIDCVIEVS